MAGFFVVFEGPDGAGKSTQVRLLAERLRATGRSVLVTREPGGTALGEALRHLLLARDGYAMLPETEALLLSAARAQHVGEVLRPALAAGSVVICDRYVDSTLAYQGGGRGLSSGLLASVQCLATGGLMPDLRVLLDLPIEFGLARRFAEAEEVNRLDAAGGAFHERVRRTYLALAEADPKAWVVLDGKAPIAEVANEVAAAVAKRLEESKPALERLGATVAGAPR